LTLLRLMSCGSCGYREVEQTVAVTARDNAAKSVLVFKGVYLAMKKNRGNLVPVMTLNAEILLGDIGLTRPWLRCTLQR